MKKIILSMMLAAIAVCGRAANNDSTLIVKLDLVDFGDTVVVYRPGKEDLTFVGKDGKFEFELQVDTVCIGLFAQPRLFRGDLDEPQYYSVPLVGGETMRVWDTDRTRFDVDGTGFYADFHKVDLFNENAGKDMRENTLKYREMKNDNTLTKEERNKFYDEVYSPSFDRYQQELIDYVKAHPNQEAAVYLLKDIDGFDKMKETFMLFEPSIREGRMRPIYDKWVKANEESIEAEAKEKEAQKKQAEGIEAPVFTLNDIEGKPLALNSLRGKYVVLDFWGSWCIWCIKGFPKMKEYYAKYSDKFEILGIDCNDTEDKWKAAVKKHELPWLHVYCPKNSSVLTDYGITGFPTKILIGPDGKIVKTIIGEDPSFYTFLDSLFGNK
jgi:thiol-disulfide isomerase/thioredoxin